jgi:NTP pyrophosphatase (non-canonical NTP hydrolase)
MNEPLLTALQRIVDLTKIDCQHKTPDELFACPAEEIGELARELKIEEKVFGNDYKTPDEGSKAEACDLFIGAICMWAAVGTSSDYIYQELDCKLIAAERNNRDPNVFALLRDAARYLDDCDINCDTAVAAMRIFFDRAGTIEEFVETVNKKLNKWEASQQGLLAKK